MKKLLVFGLGLLLLASFLTGCSEKDDTTTGVPQTIAAYALNQFVPNEQLANLINHDDDDNEDDEGTVSMEFRAGSEAKCWYCSASRCSC